MAGQILKTAKVITKTAEEITLNANNGDIVFNAAKSVKYSVKKEVIYDSYVAPTTEQTEELSVTKVTCDYKEVQVGKRYTFKAVQFSRKPKKDKNELKNIKWAYKIDDGEIKDFPNRSTKYNSNSAIKEIEIDESLWDNKTLRVYAYIEKATDDASVEVNISINESIIIVGTEQHYTNSANKLMFAAQAVREVRKNTDNHLALEVLIFKDGYTEKQLSAFSNAILFYNKKARVTRVDNTDQVINFISYGEREDKKSNYKYRKVSRVSVYAHGYIRSKTNEGVIAFGYDGTNAGKQELDSKAFNKISKDVFLSNNLSHFYSYACRTGIGVSSEIVTDPLKPNSLAQKMSNHGGIIVHAYMKRSLYEDTWGTQNHRDTYVSDNDKGSSGWENFKTDIKDAISNDPNDMKTFLEYIVTEVRVDGAIWNSKGAYLPVKAGSFPSGVSSNYETYRPN